MHSRTSRSRCQHCAVWGAKVARFGPYRTGLPAPKGTGVLCAPTLYSVAGHPHPRELPYARRSCGTRHLASVAPSRHGLRRAGGMPGLNGTRPQVQPRSQTQTIPMASTTCLPGRSASMAGNSRSRAITPGGCTSSAVSDVTFNLAQKPVCRSRQRRMHPRGRASRV